MKNLAANCFGLPDHLRHSKKGHRILKNGMVGLRIMQSWVKSSSIQIDATPDFVELLYTDGYPNYYLICLSDNDPENPVVWSTDHEEFFTEVTNEGRLNDFLDRFMTKEEFLNW